MRFYITRHGQPDIKEDTAYPPGDPALTALGQKQAQYLGEHLRDTGFCGQILSSPYYRAAETADIIANELNTYFYPEQIIREVADPVAMAKLEPMNIEQMRKQFKCLDQDAKLDFPWWQQKVTERETTEQVIARVKPLLDELAKREEDVLLVSHSGVKTRCILALLGLSSEQLQDTYPDKKVNWNCALTIIDTNPKPNLKLLRDAGHLPESMITSNKKTIKDYKNQRIT